MSTITIVSRNPDRHESLLRQLARIEIGHIQKELQARENKNFSAQFGDPAKLSSTFARQASGRTPHAISYQDAALYYKAEQLSAPARIQEQPHRDFGIVYRQKIVCRMSVYEAMERFNRKDDPTFLWLRTKGNAELFSDLRLAAAHVGNRNVSQLRATLYENDHP